MTASGEQRGNSIAGGFAVLVVRGALLWVVVPLATLSWPVVAVCLRRRGVTFGQYLGWVDLNDRPNAGAAMINCGVGEISETFGKPPVHVWALLRGTLHRFR